ncbi:MAG: DUF3806 domain-containing protein [Elusimicrobiota bacterium]|jgi:hypothetical protein|nr:DUF3806 domain-containing protein [Elusimicrobiota bacterium]
MSKEMIERVEENRNWVKGYFKSEYKYKTIEGKLYLLQGIIDQKFIKKDETDKLQSLGVVFGDALAEGLSLHWVEIEDEYGIDPALRYLETNILLFPLTILSKRIEKGEEINIKELFDGICDMVSDMANKESVK